MLRLDAKAAAERIHKAVNAALAPRAQDRHIEAFVEKVCEHLGIEPTALNCNTVAGELSRAGIVPHEAEDYPKWVKPHESHVERDGDGNLVLPPWVREHHVARGGDLTVLVHNEDEELHAVSAKETADEHQNAA